CRRERVHRVLGELRVGDMPLHAVDGEAAAQGAATTHLDGVADRDFARGLPHDAPIEALAPLAQDLRHTPRPIDRRTLLITRERVAVPLLERPGGHDVGMPGEAEHGPGAAAPGPEVLDTAKAQALDLEARRGEAPGHDLLTAFVDRRDRAACDESLS